MVGWNQILPIYVSVHVYIKAETLWIQAVFLNKFQSASVTTVQTLDRAA